MPNIYSELTGNVDKLRKNETQMTQSQKVKYKTALENLKRSIESDTRRIMADIIWNDIKFMVGEREECTAPIRRITRSQESRAIIHQAVATVIKCYDISAGIDMIRPIRDKVLYEGYAPYWLKYCRMYPPGEEVFENGGKVIGWSDLMGLGWWIVDDDSPGIWKKPGKMIVKSALPPTADMIEKEYEEVRKRYA